MNAPLKTADTAAEQLADTWTVAGRTFHSRLILGTGKYADYALNAAAAEASGTEIVANSLKKVRASFKKASRLAPPTMARRSPTLLDPWFRS